MTVRCMVFFTEGRYCIQVMHTVIYLSYLLSIINDRMIIDSSLLAVIDYTSIQSIIGLFL